MLTIFVLFVGLTLATAVIAYWSDNLGKKLGKKRVSLWGLRPRTTATFLTIASSWLIMVFTLGVMLVIFPPLRQSLLRFDEVKAQESSLRQSKKQLTGQVNELGGQLTALRDQTQSLRKQVESASVNLKKVQGQLTKSQQAATKARKARTKAQKEAVAARKSAKTFLAREKAAVKREQEARENLEVVTNQRNATQQQREQAQQKLEAARADLKQANADVKSANANVRAADARVRQADAEVKKAEAQFARAQANLTKVRKALETARENEQTALTNAQTAQGEADRARQSAEESRLAADEAEARARTATIRASEASKQAYKAGQEIIEADREVREARQKVVQLQQQSDELSRANALAIAANERLGAEADIILSSNIRVPVGRTLVARSFDSSISLSEANEELRALFGRAADKIVPGFLPGARLQLAPRLVPAPNLEKGDDKSLVLLQDDEIYDNLATAISRSQNALSVRLISERNHLEGEKTLYARFIVVPVRPALPAGEALASATFDKSIGNARLFSALLNLVEAGREVAGQSGVTPPLSPEAPDFYAPGSNEQIFETIRRIDALDGLARVTIVTAEPISTADQLRVRFEVKPAATTARSARRGAPAT